jgi:hypothetical protein
MRLLIKLFVVLLLCALEFMAYIAIAVFLGWKNGGGVIPMTILFALWVATFNIVLHWGGPKVSPASEHDNNNSEDK